MPIPKPREGESKDDFISRCIENLKREDPEKSDEQIAAICFSEYENR